jgi:porin
MSQRLLTTMLSVAALLVSAAGSAQTAGTHSAATVSTAEPTRSIEDLNLVGAAATMPPTSDTIFGTDAGFRQAMWSNGLLLRVNVVPRYSQNVLDGPVPASQQTYIGQRGTWIMGLNPMLTADLRQLHLQQAQLNIGVAWKQSNWNPAAPKTIALSTLYLYKRWGDRTVEMKAGYIVNDLEFVGLQVGGSTSTGAQGVYAVLPYQVGLSYYPLTAPSLNFRFRTSSRTYVKTAAQRSLDAAGAASTIARNSTGFTLRPEGNGLVVVGEAGYQQASSAAAHQTWLRAGYIRNSTLYSNKLTGEKESGNYCVYALADYQVRMPDPQRPAQGLYLGGTVMTVPERLNAYSRYVEARLYQRGPFASRPADVVTLVAAYRVHSPYLIDSLTAQGRTVWSDAPSLTGTYTIHASRGNFLSLSLGYSRGAAITPRVADSLTFTANWSLYL